MNIRCEILGETLDKTMDGALTFPPAQPAVAGKSEAALDLERLVWDMEYRESTRTRWRRSRNPRQR